MFIIIDEWDDREIGWFVVEDGEIEGGDIGNEDEYGGDIGEEGYV